MKNYKIIILSTLVFATTMFFTYCEQGTEPEIIKPGRSDYTWSVDTLNIFATYLSKMWGSSPTDVWAVGNGGSLDDDIWHYDGIEWKKSTYTTAGPWCIYGFARDDVWVGGADGEIWHFDGTVWSENLRYKNSNYERVYFIDIWGESSNDVYAVGFADSSNIRFGIMMHYDGNKWSRISIEFTEGILKGIKKGNKTSIKYFINNLIQFKNPDSARYFEFDGKNLKEIYYDRYSPQNITVINDEVIFSYDDAIYYYSNNNFNQIVQNPFPNAWNAVYGRNRKDIIWMMSDGLTHYNGTDFKYILEFDNYEFNDGFIRLKDGVLFEKEVFFVTHGNKNNYIFHGVLK